LFFALVPYRAQLYTPDEIEAIEDLKRASPRKVGELDPDVLYALYCKGVVYIDVPLGSADCIKGLPPPVSVVVRAADSGGWVTAVPPLEGFVMNRVSGDPFEKLLYKIWVSVDERTSMQQLAHMLQTELELVQRAVSVYVRLGFARKKNVEPVVEARPLPSSPSAAPLTRGRRARPRAGTRAGSRWRGAV
jgi:hypothetical protein